MKKLSITETELRKSVAYKKACTYIQFCCFYNLLKFIYC